MRPFPSIMLQGGLGPACVWNPATIVNFHDYPVVPSLPTPLEFKTTSTVSAGGPASVIATVGKRRGKVYFEVALSLLVSGSSAQVGISQQPGNTGSEYATFGASGYGAVYESTGFAQDADTFESVSGYPTITDASGIAMVAADLTDSLIWFGVNGVFVGNPAAGTGGLPILNTTYYPALYLDLFSSSPPGTLTGTAAFSTGSTSYTPPMGFAQWR